MPAKNRRLTKQAVPSLHLPQSKTQGKIVNKNLKKARAKRCLIRESKKNCEQNLMRSSQDETQESTASNNFEQETVVNVDRPSPKLVDSSAISSASDQLIILEQNPSDSSFSPVIDSSFSVSNCSVQTCDKEIQVPAVGVYRPGCIFQNIDSDKHLSTATGIESFKLLDAIVEMASVLAKPASSRTTLSLRDRIILTYMKLKQNLSYRFLEVLVSSISEHQIKRIFFETVQLLSACLRVWVSWPGKEEISRNLPKCFENFEDCVVVLDCTEVYAQHPSSLPNQVITYSHYKGDTTIKVMTGVSPAGHIIFVSSAYGGRVSDKVIFEQSDLVNLLEPGDAIMVDRGFLIDSVCQLNKWKLIRPPFLGQNKQFSKEESTYTAKVAAARVHIERSNQRLKVFKILGDTLPNCLLPVFEDIFTVICATVNLSAPILKSDKFMTD